MPLGMYDCPHCGIDRDPCYTKEDMERKAKAGDKTCKEALDKHLKEKEARDRMLKE